MKMLTTTLSCRARCDLDSIDTMTELGRFEQRVLLLEAYMFLFMSKRMTPSGVHKLAV